MSLNRMLARPLALVLALTLASTAAAQEYPPPQVGDVQLFAPVDVGGYNEVVPHEGFFATFELLHWNVPKAERSQVGSPGATRTVFALVISADPTVFPEGGGTRVQSNEFDTGVFEDQFHRGQRVEFGYIEDDCGWVASTYNLKGHQQDVYAAGVDVVFDNPQDILQGFIDVGGGTGTGDPDGFDDDIDRSDSPGPIYGRDGILVPVPPDLIAEYPDDLLINPTDFGDVVQLPVTFDEFKATTITKSWGVDVLRIYRTTGGQFGGWIEWGAGVRYLKFEDEFHITASGSVLGDTRINQEADNNLLGPQFGIRWFNKWNRWTHSTNFRFSPTLNYQSVRQNAQIGENVPTGEANFPLAFQPRGVDNSFHETEFSPIVELRLESSYQLTRAIAIKAGYTALYTDGLARSSTMMAYDLLTLGIRRDKNTQDAVMHGFSFGIEVNR